MTDALTSEGLVALLKENDGALQVHALNELIKDIDKCWHIVADHIETMYLPFIKIFHFVASIFFVSQKKNTFFL